MKTSIKVLACTLGFMSALAASASPTVNPTAFATASGGSFLGLGFPMPAGGVFAQAVAPHITPEPSTLVLLGVGVCALLALRRRK